MKAFLKSNAFRCLAVLLSIVIVSGGLLAIFNDLLYVYVDPNQELSDQITASFGKAYEHSDNLVTDANKTYANGSVKEGYSVNTESGTQYLVKAVGNDAFGGGTVTVWVAVECANNAVSGVGLVSFYETDVSKYYKTDDAFFANFNNHDSEVVAGQLFGTDSGIVNMTTGATASSLAINNAVNTAVAFVKNHLGGGTVTPPEPTETYVYESYINLDKTTITPNFITKEVSFAIVTKGSGEAGAFSVNVVVQEGVITSYEITKNGSTSYEETYFGDFMDAKIRDGSYFIGKTADDLKALLTEKGKLSSSVLGEAGLSTGATRSTEICFRAAVFAAANADKFLTPEYDAYVTSYEATQAEGGTAVTFTLTMKKNSEAGAFDIVVTVDNGAITAYEITKNGSTSYEDINFGDYMDSKILDGSYFVGKTADDLKDLLNEKGKTTASTLTEQNLSTGATRSTEICIRAALFATANYSSFLVTGGENE